MTQREKLVQRLQRLRSDAEAADVELVLAQHGWSLRNRRGSHLTFGKGEAATVSFPLVSGRRVKRAYVRMVLRRLGLEDE